MDPQPLAVVTVILPYYRQPLMLTRQLEEWERFPPGYSFVVVDDGSEEAAQPVVEKASPELRARLRLYRVTVDIPWNRGGARNLGTREARRDWIIHLDTDHVLPATSADAVLAMIPAHGRWYRFRRWRQGRADFTRKKDKIDPMAKTGEIHPHIDSYLVEKETYWEAGGYDEDYSGCLGGGTDFLRRLEAHAGPPLIAPDPARLDVYTTDAIADASVRTLDRNTQRGKDLARRKHGDRAGPPISFVRFPWVRVL